MEEEKMEGVGEGHAIDVLEEMRLRNEEKMLNLVSSIVAEFLLRSYRAEPRRNL